LELRFQSICYPGQRVGEIVMEYGENIGIKMWNNPQDFRDIILLI